MIKTTQVYEERVLVLAPTGQDGTLAASVLTEAGIRTAVCADLKDLYRCVDVGAATLLIAVEALSLLEIPILLDLLKRQPPWSDVPVVLLTPVGTTAEDSERYLRLFGPSGNVTLLERPLQRATLVSVMRVALRSRQRQYQIRDLLQKLEEIKADQEDKIDALEKFHDVVVGRELKMISVERENQHLKDEIARLKAPRGESSERTTNPSSASRSV